MLTLQELISFITNNLFNIGSDVSQKRTFMFYGAESKMWSDFDKWSTVTGSLVYTYNIDSRFPNLFFKHLTANDDAISMYTEESKDKQFKAVGSACVCPELSYVKTTSVNPKATEYVTLKNRIRSMSEINAQNAFWSNANAQHASWALYFPERVVENINILRTRSVQRKIPQRVLSKLIFTERVLGER